MACGCWRSLGRAGLWLRRMLGSLLGVTAAPLSPSFPLPQALPAVPTPLPSSHPVSVLPSLPRDEVQMRTAYSKSNGQPKSLGSAPPGPGQVPLSSPTRGGVKKVSGVGGTTYEISV